jgi:cytoskeletal protein RodZ
MNSSPFFSDLRKAREAKRTTLSDISDATSIDIRFLEAIEQGNTAILPQAYVRAFIREYSAVLGLDPVETLKQYERAVSTEEIHPAVQPQATEPTDQTVSPVITTAEGQASPFNPNLAKIAMVSVALAIGAIGGWNLWIRSSSPVKDASPVQNADQENRIITDPLTHGDTLHTAPLQAAGDSLTLKVSTTDSVWLVLQIDNLQPREYLFREKLTMVWKARERFRVTVGNASAMKFTLNDTFIGQLGKRRGIVRDFEIDRQLLSSH